MDKYKFDIIELKEIVDKSESFAEVTRKIGLNDKNKYHINKIQLACQKHDISTKHFYWYKYNNKWDKATKEVLLSMVDQHDSMKDILNSLDLSISTKNYKKLKKYLDDFNIDHNFKIGRRENTKKIYSKDSLQNAVKESYSYRDVCRKLGLTTTGNNNNTLKKYFKKYNIDISHFNPNIARMKALNKHRGKRELSDILVENSTYTSTNTLKKRLYKEGLKQKQCELCDQGEEWRGKRMSMILDHINGINNDNRIENLRIVCPNCNATLDTHCGKLSHEERQKRLKEREIAKKENPTGHGEKWKEHTKKIRTVERPPYDQLVKEIEHHGYSATGRLYGVSDNAIRKWIKYYEKYEL